MGTRTPTQFLAHLRSIAPSAVISKTLLKTCFLEQLPEHVSMILSILDTDDLDRIAEAGDKILDARQLLGAAAAPQPQVSAVRTDSSASTLEAILQRLEALENRLSDRSRSRHRSAGRGQAHRSKSRRRTSSPHASQGSLCWYHDRFGSKATKCEPPCSKNPALT